MSRVTLFLLALGLTLPALSAQADTKALADGLVRTLRGFQQDDGSYGDLASTCRVLDLLTRSPRRYNELDGPFFRRAAEVVSRDESPALDSLRALALAGVVTPSLLSARARALERLLASPEACSSTEGLLALATLQPPIRPPLPQPEPSDSPARAVLLAEHPASVTAPSLDDLPTWTAWARAARLAGQRPASTPSLDLPPLAPNAPLDAVLARLEFVIAVHGLPQPGGPPLVAAPPPPKLDPPLDLIQSLDLALAFLDEHQDHGRFGLMAPGWNGPEPGITALCLSATMRGSDMLGRSWPTWVDEGLDWLLAQQRPDGSIQTYGVAVYTTSVALEALLDADRDDDHAAVQRALAFLVGAQADEGEGYNSELDPHYGGVGYGGDERPDLSNTQIAVEAAWRAKLPLDHPFFAKALIFLDRNQNLGELTPHSWPRPGGGLMVTGTDGGGTYMPGNSPAGEDKLGDGVYSARSYGSMTYSLTKSFVLCGVQRDDARLKAALRWLGENFVLETNPGFQDPRLAGDGRYYYYLAMARTLSRVNDIRLQRANGSEIDWRAELVPYLLGQQRTDGSWVNEASSRWYEGAPTLCTAFALLALAGADTPM